MEIRKKLQPAEELSNIYAALRNVVLTKNQASAIVGGRGVLERLVRKNLIRMEQTHHKQNSQWKCNGEDVIRWAIDNHY